MAISTGFSIFTAGYLVEVTVYGLLLFLLRVVAANQDIDSTESEDFFEYTSYNAPI